jgi:ribose 5-phosphate isomerase A
MADRAEHLKQLAAQRAVDFVSDGQTVGLGTGSTAAFAIQGLAARIQTGLKIRGVATSLQTENLARRLGIPLLDFNDVSKLDITIDGADQIDPNFDMIKGGGGALTREKLVARISDVEVIVVDQSKQVVTLGGGFPVPVEVVPFGWRLAARLLSDLGSVPRLRETGGTPVVTDNGNWIIDSDFGRIEDPPNLEKHIKLLPGIVESGLFIGLADVMVVGSEEGAVVHDRAGKKKLSRLDEI